MARNDIRFFGTVDGSEPGKGYYPLTASASFDEGDIVVVAAAGGLGEAADDPASVSGIAAMRSTDADGSVVTTGTPITYYTTADANLFVTNNFATDGGGTSATPTQANAVGAQAGLTRSSGTWSVDTGTANLLVRIEKVLDDKGHDISDPLSVAGSGDAVVFRFLT